MSDMRSSVWDEAWDARPGPIAYKSDNERLRWVLDAKVRTLASLVSLQVSGKGGEPTQKLITQIVTEIAELKP